MTSYFIAISAAGTGPKVHFLDGDNWDYTMYEWTCEDIPQSNLQIKTYSQLPYTTTETIDLFNRLPETEVPVE